MKRFLERLTSRRGLRLVAACILLLLGSAVLQSVLSAKDVKRIVGEDFNRQQLELARHAAGILTENIKYLKRELTTLSLSPSIQYIESVSWANRMKISFSAGRDNGLTRISLINTEGARAYSINYTNAVFVEEVSYGGEDYFVWCRRPENKGRIFISEVRRGVLENSEPGFLVFLAIPVYQVSTDDAHPQPTHAFSGVLVFVLDAGQLTAKVVGPIRSGRTGYAWVIDESGKFLYHLEEDFIGQNAFEVRKTKDPRISFTKIDVIQKSKMLTGEEGTSWYISGWHRGAVGQVRKLIAYAPVHIEAANGRRLWSVAVVAPSSEVEDAVQGVYIRQTVVQGTFIAAAIIILVVFISLERVWLHTLEDVVREKTGDLKRYADQLEQSEARYRSLIESADDLIISLDEEGRVLSVNHYYTRLTGIWPEEVVGRRLTEVLEYSAPGEVEQAVGTVQTTGETLETEEEVRIGGRVHWLDTKYKPILDAGSPRSPVLVISRDITEHKSMEAQLFQAEKLASLGALSAGVAHEINNPLAVILGFTEMLIERFPEGSEEHQILKTIDRQGTNCQRIVENLLAFSRLPPKSSEETDVIEDVRRVITMITNSLITRKIDLKTDLEEALPRVRGDGRQLEQVFLNIINNAVAAMEGGGVLTISARQADGLVAVGFADTGPGIPPEIRDKVFEPFFTTKKVGEGTGLGLSLSYGIVKKFGGRIQVESRVAGEGRAPGTTFTVVLPVAGNPSPAERG
ncbi:MAG: ATP-binding protein [Thermodesulfobacteriota bacterium]